jgi:hypothetical protein
VAKKEDETILKYSDLTTETQRMSNTQANGIPQITVATASM